MSRTRLFLVDDHAIVISGLRSELADRFDIVGSALDVAQAIDGILTSQPDVVLLDVHMPGGGGRRVLDAVLGSRSDTKFLAFSVSDAADDVIDVVRGGAKGYVTKTISLDELTDAVERVQAGESVFSPQLAGFVLEAFSAPTTMTDEVDLLTQREAEVMRLIARGFTYKKVAASLDVSIKTVETHMTSVLRKLQLSSRAELAVWAAARNLV